MMPRLHPLRTLAGLLLLCAASIVLAATEDEESFFEPLPVVLSMARMPQPLRDTPGAVTVIDADLIAATGYRELNRLFRLAPGMQVAHGRNNGQWGTYHGIGSEYPNQGLMLIDGRSFYSPHFSGNPTWLALNDIKRIEIVRGLNSTAYGSNAAMGVINIITRLPDEESGGGSFINIGSSGIRDVGAHYSTNQGPLGLHLSVQHREDQGLDDLPDDRRINALNMNGNLHLGAGNELGFDAGISDNRYGMGVPGSAFDNDPVRTANNNSSSLHLKWRQVRSADEEWSLAWYQNRERNRDRWTAWSTANLPADWLLRYPAWPVDQAIPIMWDSNSRRDNIEYQHSLQARPDLRLLWGAEWRKDWYDKPYHFYSTGAQSRNEQRLFGNLEWRSAPTWLWNAGLMAESVGSDSPRLAPRLFLNWQPAPERTWRIGYSRAWRQPPLFDQAADIRIVTADGELLQKQVLPNPAIRPQRIDAFEIGFLGALPQGQASLDMRLFHERIHDMIMRRGTKVVLDGSDNSLADPNVVQRVLGSSYMDNEPEGIALNGFEIQLRLRPWYGTELIFNQTLLHARADFDALERNIVPHTATLTWLQRIGPWSSTLSLLHMGAIETGVSFLPQLRQTVPEYTTLDWSVARMLRLEQRQVEFRLTGINLLGKHDELAYQPLRFMPPSAESLPTYRIGPQIHASIQMPF